MRSSILYYPLLATLIATSAVVVACSSSPSTGGDGSPITHPGDTSSGSGSSGSSSGGSSSGGGSSGGGSGSSGSGSGSSSGGSSSGSTVDAGPTSTISADTTWADGMKITGPTTIAAGVTVTIANGATITVSAGASITIEGTLTATNATKHAVLTGTGWPGLVIAAGGTLNANSLDISGATLALDVTGTAEYDAATITSSTPFKVEINGALTTKNATVTTATGESTIEGGTFTASYLDYDANASGALEIAAGTVNISDSTFHTTVLDSPPDMITSSGPSSLTMIYTEIAGRHCSFHFDDVTSFDLENLNVHDSDYGFMMWGSTPTSGTRVVKNSNFDDQQYGIHEEGTNGPITVTGCYFSSTSAIHLADQEITISGTATAANANVGPRPAQ